jgi:uncharacterized protein with PIN domain
VELRQVAKETVRGRLPSGSQRTYETFAECSACGHTYWRGAHAERLESILQNALRHVKDAESAANAA